MSPLEPILSPNPQSPGHHVLIIHEVQAYQTWKRVFDSAATIRQAAGERSYLVLHDTVDSDVIIHFSTWTSHADARRFFESPQLEKIRQEAGVRAPRFLYLGLLEHGILEQPTS